MDPSLSPQPSSSGLVCAELRASWPAWTGSVSHTSRPKATTPFHHASDFTYFDDPPAPKEKKKDPLVQILKDAGFETTPEPEPEPEPQVWSPAPLEEMFKHTEPPSRMTQKKGKRNERVTRDISEEEFQSSSHGTSSQRTDPMDPTAVSKLPLKIKLAPITSSNSSRISSIIQSAQKTNPSPVKRPIPTAAKTRKRKTDDTSSHEQYLISSTQPTLRSKVSQKIQTAEAKTQSQPNIHLAQSIHDSAGIRSNETATKQDTQRKQNTVPSSKRRRQDEMIGSDPALRIQNSSPDATEPVLQYQDPVAKMIEIDSDGGIPVLEDRSLELTKPIVSNTAASSDNLLVPQLEQASEAVRFRASPEDEVETNHLPNQVFGRIAPNSSREGLRPARLSSTPNNSTEAETRSDIAGSSLMPGHEYAPDTPAPTREVEPEYTATSSLGSLCLKDSQNDNAPDFRAKFGGSTDIYHSAPEMLWKEAVTDDSPTMVLRHIVSTLHRTLKSKEDVIDGISTEYRENALRLIRNLRSRHSIDLAEASKARKKATQEIISVFAAAERDLRELVEDVKALDVEHVATNAKHPNFTKKLDLLRRLHDEKSKRSAHQATKKILADDAMGSDGEEGEALIAEFQSKLASKVKHADPATERVIQKLYAKANMRLREATAQNAKEYAIPQLIEEKKPKPTFYDIMEEMVDTMISEMRQTAEDDRSDSNVNVAGDLLSNDENDAISVHSNSS